MTMFQSQNVQWYHWMFWIYDHCLNYVRVKFLETIQTSILVLFYALHFDLMARFWIFLWWIVKAFSISSNSSKEEFVYLYIKHRVSCSLTILILKIACEISKQEGNIRTSMRRTHSWQILMYLWRLLETCSGTIECFEYMIIP